MKGFDFVVLMAFSAPVIIFAAALTFMIELISPPPPPLTCLSSQVNLSPHTAHSCSFTKNQNRKSDREGWRTAILRKRPMSGKQTPWWAEPTGVGGYEVTGYR